MTNNTDEELLVLVKRKNTNAFHELFKRYQIGIFNYILKYTGDKALSQELLQETFTKLWFSAYQFDPMRGRVKNWLFTIALNVSRNEVVKKHYTYKFEDVAGRHNVDSISKQELPDALMEQEDLKQQVARAIGKLTPALREVVILKHFQQLKFREIANITNTAESTLKSRFIKAMAELKKHLGTSRL